jgi:hypothetical protein
MLTVCVPARRRAMLIVLPLLLAALILMSVPAPAFAQSECGRGRSQPGIARLGASDFSGRHHHPAVQLIGIAGSYGVAWFGIRVNTSPTRAPRSPACAAKRIPATRFR